jgi:hypothetical protein
MPGWGDDFGEDWGGQAPVIGTHKNDAIKRLISQFRKPILEKLVENFGTRAQTLEDVLANFPGLFDLDTAHQRYLDIIGSILNQPRYAYSDMEYRVFVKVKAQIVKRRTTVEDLLSMMRQLVNDDTRDIAYYDAFPKSYKLEVEDLTIEEVLSFIPYLRLAKPATYIGKFIIVSSDSFACSDATGAVEDLTDLGFGDASGFMPGIGGELAYIVKI